MSVFNGRWKLVKVENAEACYKAIGFSAKEIEENAWMDDPSHNIEMEVRIQGDQYSTSYHGDGQQLYSEEATLGKQREVDYEGVKYKTTVRLEGDALCDASQGEGQKEAHFKRTVSGNKMFCVMTGGGVTCNKEFVRVK